MTLQGIDICQDCGDQFPPSGEALALFVALVAAIPLAALGIGLALSRLPSRWTRPWIGQAIYTALIAQGGCLAAGILSIVIFAGTFVGDFNVLGVLLVTSPLLLHTALNVAGIVAWRRVAEAFPARVERARSIDTVQ
jgi:hypothetical protein